MAGRKGKIGDEPKKDPADADNEYKPFPAQLPGEHDTSRQERSRQRVIDEQCKYTNSIVHKETSVTIQYLIETTSTPHTEEKSNTFFMNLEKLKSSVILLVGNAGVGKTTLACTATYGWTKCFKNKFGERGASDLRASIGQHLSWFSLVVYVPLNAVNFATKKFEDLEDMAQVAGIESSRMLASALTYTEDRLLIIFDGWDELIRKCKTKEDNKKLQKSIFGRLVSKQTLGGATVLILTRPIGECSVQSFAKKVHKFELVGFVEADMKKYVLDEVSDAQSKEKIKDHFKYFTPLVNLCQVPLFCVTLIKMYTGSRRSVSITTTEILLKFTIASINHSLKKNQRADRREIHQLANLSEELLGDFHKICRLALADCTGMKVDEAGDADPQLEEKTRLNSLFRLNHGIGSFEELNNLGLVEIKIVNDVHQYKFCHLTLEEFLAAIAIQIQPPVNQIHIVRHHLHTLVVDHENIIPFCCGLTALDMQPSGSLDTTKLALPAILQLLVCLEDSPDDYNTKKVRHQEINFLSRCINESKDSSLWKKLFRIENRRLEILLGDRKLDYRFKEGMVDMVKNSGIRHWSILSPEGLTNLAEELKDEIKRKSETCRINTKIGTNFALVPTPSISRSSSHESPCEISTHLLCIKTLRNIFHRILQLNAPTRLKSDGNNPSYISFLCCKCLKDKFDRCYEIKPIHAIHWLPGPKLPVPRSGASLSPDEQHFIREHNNEQLELVIMMTPYPTLLKFVVDGTSEEVSIILSDRLDSSNMDGEIAKDIEKVISDEVSLVRCIQQVSTNEISKMILPSLPLPERQVQGPTGGSTTTEIPVPPQPDAAPRHSTSQAMEATGERISPTVMRQQNPLRPEDDATDVPSSRNQNTLRVEHFHTPTNPQAHSTQRTMAPGTVLFTSLPRQISSDRIQPLPNETQLIKRGGNGAIYADTIEGMSVAVKKTHYRSKEFTILTKINHPNIMPTLAIILGHENPTSRRRFYCYHVMPRLTGDCARMLTDKEEFTMRNLRQTHRENPRILGLMQSNFKYIIRETLKGLSYLHRLHIAHRDIKGSNILLKFFCSCNNPLECSCESKFQVVITDYDAAVELDQDGKLQPSSSSGHASSTTGTQYHCVPVGTNGYRAPECAFHVVTNSPDCFSPPISTACDIWSLGLLVYRMLLGREGPYRQRDMAILLLRYHQVGGYIEGVSKRNRAHVDDYTLEGVLPLSLLRREMGWFRNSSSFVEHALRLDPLRRYSAEQLLEHGFLN